MNDVLNFIFLGIPLEEVGNKPVALVNEISAGTVKNVAEKSNNKGDGGEGTTAQPVDKHHLYENNSTVKDIFTPKTPPDTSSHVNAINSSINSSTKSSNGGEQSASAVSVKDVASSNSTTSPQDVKASTTVGPDLSSTEAPITINNSFTTENTITPIPLLPPNNITTTPSTPTTTTPKPPCNRFDASSFVGGIVLTLGLLSIGLVAYKFFKGRNERSYQTL